MDICKRLVDTGPLDQSAFRFTYLYYGFYGLVICLGLMLIIPGPLRADDLAKLLQRLDLKQLQATHVEQRLSQTVNIEKQKQLRNQLAKLYVQQLSDFIEAPKEFARVADRLNELEGEVPDLTSPEVLFQRLEIQFRHGEHLLSKYRDDRRQVELLVEIHRVFAELADKFQALEQVCEDKIEKLENFDGGLNSLANLKADNEIDRLSEFSFRASFYAGWSFFNVGVSKQNSKLGKKSFVRALSSFCTFLDVDPEDDVSSWDRDFLELGSNRNAQAFLGIALSYLAVGQNSDADECFELLREEGTAEAIKSQLAFWQIQSMLEFGKVDDGIELANAYLANVDAMSALQRGQIALLAIRFAYASPKLTDSRSQLGLVGFKVLAQLRQFSLTKKLIEEYKVSLPTPSFYTDWIEGQRIYQDAEKSGLETDYLKAATRLQAAVLQEKDIPVVDLEGCRYQLGWSYYKGSEFQQAADCFELVIARIARLDPRTAATACWLQHDCYLKISKDNPALAKKALAVLENLVSRFPESELSKKARLQMVKLRQTSMKTEDAVSKLKEVVASSPNDLLSQYELCLANYRKYLELIRDKQETASVELEVQKNIAGLNKAANKLTAQQKLKLSLIELDIQTRTNKNDRARIDSLVTKATLAAREIDNKLMLAEFHYRQLNIAKDRKNETSVNEHIDWLMKNGDGTVYQKSVLVTRAQQVEKALKENGAARSATLQKAIDVYQKLAKASGYNSHSIQNNTNARVAVTRLATLMEEAGNLEGAEQNLELLVKAFPKKVSYLIKYARLLSKAKKYGQALPHWRTLVSGLTRESDNWYLAKYSVFQCLSKTSRKDAEAPLRQFLGLYDPPAPWKAKFNDLADELGIK